MPQPAPPIAAHSDSAVDILRGLPVRTKMSVAACAAVGLTYWAEHPGVTQRGRYVWALDDEQRAHIVHVCGGASSAGTGEHVCSRAARRTDGQRRIWRNWTEAGFINEHGQRQHSGYDLVNGIKDSFRGTHIPQCGGDLSPAPIKSFDL